MPTGRRVIGLRRRREPAALSDPVVWKTGLPVHVGVTPEAYGPYSLKVTVSPVTEPDEAREAGGIAQLGEAETRRACTRQRDLRSDRR